MMFSRFLPLVCLAFFLLNSVVPAADWPRWRGPENTGWVTAGADVPRSLPAEPKLLWEVKLGDGVGSPAVAQRRVFCLDNRNGKETLCAYDLAGGKELWNVPIDDTISDNQGAGPRGTPVVDGDSVFVQSCRGEFQCLNAADGHLIWRVNFVKDFAAEFIGEKGAARAPAATAIPARRWWMARGSSLASAVGMGPASSASTNPTAKSSGSRKTTSPATRAP